MTPWSVRPRAGCPSSAARAAIASILQAPSSSEYSLWAWRWTAAGVLTGGVDHANRGRCQGTVSRPFRAISVRNPVRAGEESAADPGAGARAGPDFARDPGL